MTAAHRGEARARSLGRRGIRSLRLALALALAGAGCARGVHPGPAAPEARAVEEALPDSGGYRGRFNNHDQHHADFCVRLRGASAELRYADGSPSGFSLSPGILIPQPGSGVWCPDSGMARLDAREIVAAADGRPMLFHRGGWSFLGQDRYSAVHYGHLLVADLDSIGLRYTRPPSDSAVPYANRWSPSPLKPWIDEGQRDGNGSPCARRSSTPEYVAVRSIPADMRYLNSSRKGSVAYAIYGDPSEDLGPNADRDRGIRYTLLEWSWINVRGGGVARALVREGEAFYRCEDVPAIRLASVVDATEFRHNGWVEAVYGAVRSGNDFLYGWIVSAHRHESGPVVRHLIASPEAFPAPVTLPLWAEGAPGSPAPGDTGRAVQRPEDERGPIARITDVTRPTLTLYRPPTTHGPVPAVLVFPGGGYQWLAENIEGSEVCRWVIESGVACALVRYRVPQPNDSTRFVKPLQDAQRAMGLVRQRAAEWGIDPRRVGAMGFSAGAHLAALLSNQHGGRSYPVADAADRQSARPDFALVIYPGYLAVNRDTTQVRAEVRPTRDTPPTFIAQAQDDPVGPWNAIAYHHALVAARVPAELHLYPRGGHGFGLRAGVNDAAASWPLAALRWMAGLHIVRGWDERTGVQVRGD